MSSTFEQHLLEISAELYAPSDNSDFAVVRDFIIDIVKDNKLLTSTCKVEPLEFGSRALGIHKYESDYDVMLVLEFPYFEDIFVRTDQHRPGMVHLDFKDLPFNTLTADALLDNRCYLKREGVQTWMQGILMNVVGRQVRGKSWEYYRLRYHRGPNCHTIIAESETRVFSIDFVPAIKIHFDDSDWQAIPKWAAGPKRSDGNTFLVSAIEDEIYRFELGGSVIRNAVVLLKALCEAKNLPKIRNYHLVSTAIRLIERDDFDDSSLEYVFLDLLYDLIDALEDNDLSYISYGDLNLLTNFKPHQVLEYVSVLDSVYSTLKTYPYQYNLSYERCSWHFFGNDEDDYDY
ncbi:uncharacterized protein LOC108044848 [Drosophila rhopaloa]|uniref:Uncharacterized protein LOC108044848 n=1 Tax=Drosophila rhopaloa TaxID=1041015 RepID=A0A6P4EWL3_DRORH|nr:uncharacterized protein LOC108044848 [Drosophila rhopaloa]